MARATSDLATLEQYAFILQHTSDLIALVDQQGRYVYTSPSFEKVLGYDPTGLIGTSAFTLLHPDDVAATQAKLVQVLAEGRVEATFRHQHANGSWRWIEAHGTITERDGERQIVAVLHDVTERKQAETALRESEQRYRTLVDFSPDPIAVHRGGQLVYVNAAGVHLMGANHPDELLGRAILDFVHPAYHALVLARTRQTQQERTTAALVEERFIRLDGRVIDVETVAMPTTYEGQPATQVVMRDITERRRAEQALRDALQRLNFHVENSPFAVIEWDREFRVARWSHEAERLFGWSAAEVLGRRPGDWRFVYRSDASHVANEIAALYQGRQQRAAFLNRNYNKYGNVLHCEWYNSALLDDSGQLVSVLSMVLDVTERMRAVQSLRFLDEASTILAESLDDESTLARLARLAVPQLADGCTIHRVTPDGEVVQVAAAYAEPGKATLFAQLNHLYPVRIDHNEGIALVVRTGQPEILFDVPLAHWQHHIRDDEHLHLLNQLNIRSSMCLPLGARGRILGAMGFYMAESGRHFDATDRELAEELAYRAAVALDNARLYREAQDAIHARDQFLSVASHELKTPLTTLLGNAQLLERRNQRAGTATERDVRALRVIVEQAQRLNRMMAVLLDISRLETGQLQLERAPLDLCVLAQRVANDVWPTLDQHTLHIRRPDTPIMINGDEMRLEQVLQNLVQNAIKYSPNGGLITLHVGQRGDQAEVAVSDQGMGIPAAALPHLFQRFYRASNADPQHISGIGIGLYVVKEIVDLHGGTVAVESVEGEGSTFTVFLPRT